MLQRVQWVVIAALAAVVVVLGHGTWTSRSLAREAAEQARAEREALLERLEEAQRRLAALEPTDLQAPEGPQRAPAARTPYPSEAVNLRDVDHWRARLAENAGNVHRAMDVIEELLEALPPAEAIEVFAALWSEMDVELKGLAFVPFVRGAGHPHALRALDLAARDEALGVQRGAFRYLHDIAFQDFNEDYQAYLQWSDAKRDRPLGEVLVEGAQDHVARLAATRLDEAGELLDRFPFGDWDLAEGAGVDLRETLREAGLPDLIAGWLVAGERRAAGEALQWVRQLQPDEEWLREHVLPIMQPGGDPGLVSLAAEALARADCAWAAAPLTEELLSRARSGRIGDRGTHDIARALGRMGAPRSIPALIALRGEGNMSAETALCSLTGVRYDDRRDGTWWREWWERNRGRFPDGVSEVAVPDLK